MRYIWSVLCLITLFIIKWRFYVSRKILAGVMVAVMFFTMIPQTTFAEERPESVDSLVSTEKEQVECLATEVDSKVKSNVNIEAKNAEVNENVLNQESALLEKENNNIGKEYDEGTKCVDDFSDINQSQEEDSTLDRKSEFDSAVDADMSGVLSNGDLLNDRDGVANSYLLRNNRSKGVAKANRGKTLNSLDEKEFSTIVSKLSNLNSVSATAKFISVNVKGYGITRNNIGKIVDHIFNCSPELFYFKSNYRYSFYGNYVNSITFYYKDSPRIIKQKKFIVNNEVKKFDKLVKPGMSMEDKILLVHDYLAINTVYDIDALNSGKYSEDIYNIFGVFGNKMAVCQGYALAAEYLLNRHGVRCGIASSDRANHAWNVVRINGKWYHMDVTWDDPVRDNLGRVTHKYLLISDQELFKKEQDASRKDYLAFDRDYSYVPANDNYFTNRYWKNSNAMIYYYKGDWYYMDSSKFKLIQYDKQSGKHNVVVDQNTINRSVVWQVVGNPNSHWIGNFSKITAVDNKLYFSTPKEIFVMDLDNLRSRPYSIFNVGNDTRQIFGLGLYSNEVIFALREAPTTKVDEMDGGMLYTSGITATCKSRIYKVKSNYNQFTVDYSSVKMIGNDGKKIPMHYRIYYKTKVAKTYKYIETTKLCATIKKLNSNYRYQVYVRPFYFTKSGGTINGKISNVLQIVTNPLNRYIPVGKINSISSVYSTKMNINTKVPIIKGGKTTCQLAYKKLSDKNFKYKYFSGNSFRLTNLKKNTKYQVKLRYKHTDTKSGKKIYSRYSGVKIIKTKN